MASLLDDYGRELPDLSGQNVSLLTGGPAGSDVGGFLDYLGKQIGDENLRRAGVDPDVARFWQGAVAEHPELRLPASPAVPYVPQPGVPVLSGGSNADPYTPFDPAAAIARINQRSLGDIGTQYGGAFEGGLKIPTRAGNIARVDVRGPGNELQDVKPMTGRAIGSLLDEHLASGGVDLYGGRGTGPADVTVTLPPGVTRPADIAARGQQMVDQATAMTQNVPEGVTLPRYWYQAGAKALHGATGQDLEATERLAAAHAITSPQTDVAGNSNFAVNAWNQSLLGQPIAVTNAQRNAALEDTLYGSTLPATRKTGPFFENHMRNLDPTIANNLTNDIWQMRQAGYTGPKGEPYSATPGVGEDNYVRMMVDRATRQLNAGNVDGGGWTPEQVQAALWVHAKTLQETGEATPASYNFKDALERLHAGQSNAHEAGPALLGDAHADPQAQDAFRQGAGSLLVDPLGRDVVNASLGMLTPPNKPGPPPWR
jgi:hypothetical protein